MSSHHAIVGIVNTPCLEDAECKGLLRRAQWDSPWVSKMMVEFLWGLIVNEGRIEAIEGRMDEALDMAMLDDKYLGNCIKFMVKDCWCSMWELYSERWNAKRVVLLEFLRRGSLCGYWTP